MNGTAQSYQRNPLCRFAARNRGMIATGNHCYLDSLHEAPPPEGGSKELLSIEAPKMILGHTAQNAVCPIGVYAASQVSSPP